MSLTLTAVRAPHGVALNRSQLIVGEAGGRLGRGRNNDWILPDPARLVSAHHCVIQFRGGQYQLTDLSTNGTFVNGAQRPLGKGQSTTLRHGDQLGLGDYRLEVALADVEYSSPRRHLVPRVFESRAPAEDERLKTLKTRERASSSEDHEHSSAGRLRRQLAAAMGIRHEPLSQRALSQAVEEYAEQAELIVDGLIRLLNARAGIKHRLGLELTALHIQDSNPLKRSGRASEAIEQLFVHPEPGQINAREALKEAFDNVSDHQMALITSLKAGFRQALESLEPERCLEQLESSGKIGRIGRNKAKMWEAYQSHFDALLNDREGAFSRLFGTAFVEAYESQIETLEQERRRRSQH